MPPARHQPPRCHGRCRPSGTLCTAAHRASILGFDLGWTTCSHAQQLVYPASDADAEWGSSGIEVEIDSNPATEASITTNLGASKSTFESLSPVGCDIGEEIVTAKNASDRIKFTGYLSASVLYDSHDPINGAKNMDTAVTAAVAIQAMSTSEAENIKDGEGARIDVKQWNIPLMPETRAGTVDLDEIDSETESDWYVLGLIPTTENLNDGFRSLSEWHKPITIHGYLISPTTVNGSAFRI